MSKPTNRPRSKGVLVQDRNVLPVVATTKGIIRGSKPIVMKRMVCMTMIAITRMNLTSGRNPMTRTLIDQSNRVIETTTFEITTIVVTTIGTKRDVMIVNVVVAIIGNGNEIVILTIATGVLILPILPIVRMIAIVEKKGECADAIYAVRIAADAYSAQQRYVPQLHFCSWLYNKKSRGGKI
jgi:hypothetical protein